MSKLPNISPAPAALKEQVMPTEPSSEPARTTTTSLPPAKAPTPPPANETPEGRRHLPPLNSGKMDTGGQNTSERSTPSLDELGPEPRETVYASRESVEQHSVNDSPRLLLLPFSDTDGNISPQGPAGNQTGRPQRLRLDRKESAQSRAQSRFTRRLSGITPADLHPKGVAVYVTSPLTGPRAFQDITREITRQHLDGGLDDEDLLLLGSVRIVLLFCDFAEEEEVELGLCFNVLIAELGDTAPPVIFLNHSGPDCTHMEPDRELNFLSEAMDVGIDCTIAGEPEGIELACAVQSEIMSREACTNFFNRSLDENHKQFERAVSLTRRIHNAVWGYYRLKKKLPIPDIEEDLGVCTPGATFGCYRIGSKLAEGATGKVFVLKDLDGSNLNEVVKCIDKSPRTSIAGINNLFNEITIMQRLASPHFAHDNIIKLYEIYHTETDVLYRMEDGGSMNLFKFLRSHQQQHQPISLSKAKSIIFQALDGMCHMHIVAKVVHRDIKCENIVVFESDSSVVLKLCDFDLSRVMKQPGTSSFYGGTFPFMAPELLLDQRYNPFPTDIWSMGIVFTEVICVSDVFVKLLNLPRIPNGDRHRANKERTMLGTIHEFIARPGSIAELIEKFHGAELGALVDSPSAQLVEAMLKVDGVERITAQEIVDNLDVFRE